MDNYERAFYDQFGDKNRSAIRSALEFVLWVEAIDPAQDAMAKAFHALPDTEQQRLKNATKYVKSLTQGKQKND